MVIFRMLLLLAVAVSLIVSDPALAAKKKKIERAPGDVAYSRSEAAGQFPPSVFQHWRHVAQYRCFVCHSVPFEMKQSEAPGKRMHEMDKCGSCHNGATGFEVGIGTCNRCHITTAKESGSAKKKPKEKKEKSSKEKADRKEVMVVGTQEVG